MSSSHTSFSTFYRLVKRRKNFTKGDTDSDRPSATTTDQETLEAMEERLIRIKNMKEERFGKPQPVIAAKRRSPREEI